MRRRFESIRVEQLIDEGVVCLVALQGDQAGQSDIVVSALKIIAITFVTGIERCTASRSSRLAGLARFGAVQPDASRRRWARRQSSLAWQLDDRAAPYTVPMKVVPHQCGALGRSRPALPAQSGGVVGPSSPSVPVRRMPHAGRLVQPLRSR